MLDKEEAMEKLEEEDANGDGKLTFEELLDKQYGYTMEDVANLQAGKSDADEEGAYDVSIIILISYTFFFFFFSFL